MQIHTRPIYARRWIRSWQSHERCPSKSSARKQKSKDINFPNLWQRWIMKANCVISQTQAQSAFERSGIRDIEIILRLLSFWDAFGWRLMSSKLRFEAWWDRRLLWPTHHCNRHPLSSTLTELDSQRDLTNMPIEESQMEHLKHNLRASESWWETDSEIKLFHWNANYLSEICELLSFRRTELFV